MIKIDTISFLFAGVSTPLLTWAALIHHQPIIAIGICANSLALCLALIRLIKGENNA